MSTVLIIAPHPDDETIGCGGTMLRHADAGDDVHWLIVTAMDPADGFSADRIASRDVEIETVGARLKVAGIHRLGFPTARLDDVPTGDLVGAIKGVVDAVKPDTLYVPFRNDVHTDHKRVFDAAAGCTKWFRCPSVRRALCYEVPSETDFGVAPDAPAFRPNVFVDISPWLEEKLDITRIYASELGPAPFPRSLEVIEAMARLRGAAAGFKAAEGFMLLKETVPLP